MRLIDADAFENYVFDEWMKNEVSNGDWVRFREWLKDQQTIIEFQEPITKVVVMGTEYVPLIRCKYCKNWDKSWQTIEGCHYCGMIDKQTEEEFFCGDGEREEE